MKNLQNDEGGHLMEEEGDTFHLMMSVWSNDVTFEVLFAWWHILFYILLSLKKVPGNGSKLVVKFNLIFGLICLNTSSL